MEPDTADEVPPLVLMKNFGPVKSTHLLQTYNMSSRHCSPDSRLARDQLQQVIESRAITEKNHLDQASSIETYDPDKCQTLTTNACVSGCLIFAILASLLYFLHHKFSSIVGA